MYQGTLVLHIS